MAGIRILVWVISVILISTGLPASCAASPEDAPATPRAVGFGSLTRGGEGKPVVHVTSLEDSGPGSLRAALRFGNRVIVFDVAGEIHLKELLRLHGPAFSHITVDGSTAPKPGITLLGPPIRIANGAHDIILSNFRHRGRWPNPDGTRNERADCISVYNNCYNILLDRLSVSGYEDQGISICERTWNVTIQNCILGPGVWKTHNYPLFIAFQPRAVTLYRNLIANTEYRNPQVAYGKDDSRVSDELCADIVNNLVWNYLAYGASILYGAKANVVGNYFYTSRHPGKPGRALSISERSAAFSGGNISQDRSEVSGNIRQAFEVEPFARIRPSNAKDAAVYVQAHAGCRVGGLDDFDRKLLAQIRLKP